MEITGCFVTFLDQVKYVVFHKLCYNYNVVGRPAMIFLSDEVSSGENMYDESNWVT